MEERERERESWGDRRIRVDLEYVLVVLVAGVELLRVVRQLEPHVVLDILGHPEPDVAAHN